MSIIVGNDTKLVISGLTGREGTFHGLRNRDYGTDVVAGVTPKKGGQDVEGIPVFNTIAEAVEATQANTSMLFVPPRFAVDAIYLFPWARVLRDADLGKASLIEMGIFIAVILIGLGHAARRGLLRWL